MFSLANYGIENQGKPQDPFRYPDYLNDHGCIPTVSGDPFMNNLHKSERIRDILIYESI